MENMWIPAIEEESAYGTREVQLRTRMFTTNRLFLNGPIDSAMADRFVEQLIQKEMYGYDPVTVYINSPGGEINAGLLIYDAIQAVNFELTLICAGRAASMAAIILAGGQKGRRFILPHSEVMIHEPLIQGGVGGSATSIKTIADSIVETRKLVNDLLAKHTEKNIREINKATSYDHYMTAEEAVKFGICDQIVHSLV